MKAVGRWAPAVAWMALIFFFSHQPHPLPALTHNAPDWGLHFGAYALLGLGLARAAMSQWPGRSVRAVGLGALAAGSLYGAADEWHQSFILQRDASGWDWIADTIGAAVGTAWVARRRLTGGTAPSNFSSRSSHWPETD